MEQLPTIDIKELCAQRLKDLRQFITTKDKQKAISDKNYSRQTVDDYLKGNVKKADIALDLIDFFEPIVKTRLHNIKKPLVAA
jgi:hypothetical protein